MVVRIAVCDDERVFAEGLRNKLKVLFASFLPEETIEIILFGDGQSLLDDVRSSLYEVIFLDIEMPGLNGLEIAEQLKDSDENYIIVFTTNRDDLVFEALDSHPAGFLRKSHIDRDLPDMISYILKNKSSNEIKLTVKHKGGYAKIFMSDIVYLENMGNTMTYITTKGKLETRESVYKKESELTSYGFVRIHASFLVNMDHVYQVNKSSLVMDNGDSIPISRNRYKAIKDRFIKERVFEDG